MQASGDAAGAAAAAAAAVLNCKYHYNTLWYMLYTIREPNTLSHEHSLLIGSLANSK